MTDFTPESLAAEMAAANAAYRDAYPRANLAAVRYLAAVTLRLVPDATHLLIESSDQGHFMSLPHLVEVDGHVAIPDPALSGVDPDEYGFDDLRDPDRDNATDLWRDVFDSDDQAQLAASNMEWGGPWQQYVDRDLTYTRPAAGYYALDVRRIRDDALAETPAPTTEAAALDAIVAAMREGLAGPGTNDHDRIGTLLNVSNILRSTGREV